MPRYILANISVLHRPSILCRIPHSPRPAAAPVAVNSRHRPSPPTLAPGPCAPPNDQRGTLQYWTYPFFGAGSYRIHSIVARQISHDVDIICHHPIAVSPPAPCRCDRHVPLVNRHGCSGSSIKLLWREVQFSYFRSPPTFGLERAQPKNWHHPRTTPYGSPWRETTSAHLPRRAGESNERIGGCQV